MRPIFLLLIVLLSLPAAKASAENAGWDALRAGGHAALIRHALAPGTGDPAEFRLDDCSTQRNLSAEGRAQAARLGQAFRDQGLESLPLFSSRWCRSLETAELMAVGPVRPLPFLDSFFRDRSTSSQQTRALRDFLLESRNTESVILITHQVNITGLTGVFPASGEVIVVRMDDDGEAALVSRITVP